MPLFTQKASAPTPPPITPLPLFQVITVLLVQTSEGMNINVLFPFLAFMIEDLGYGGHRLGYYAGGLAASFCGAQFLSSYLWGKFSDRYGRKPAIIIGTLGAGLGMLVFGLAKTYSMAVVGRIISGLLCGNLGVLKSFLTEITDDSNRGLAFSYMSVAWNVGCLLAPITGGFLCKPAIKYPYLFSQEGLFGTFPYLLPCLVCVIWNLVATVCAYFTMEETRKTAYNCSCCSSSGNRYLPSDNASDGDIYDSNDAKALEMVSETNSIITSKGAYAAVSLSTDEELEQALEQAVELGRVAGSDSVGSSGDDNTYNALNERMRGVLLAPSSSSSSTSSSSSAAKGAYSSVRVDDVETFDVDKANISKFSIESQGEDDEGYSGGHPHAASCRSGSGDDGKAREGCCPCCARGGAAPSPLKSSTVLKAVGNYGILGDSPS